MDKKELAAQRLKERTASKRFKLPEGTTTFRVLPNKKGVEKPEYIEYAMHSNVGARKAYLRCGKKRDGTGECWLCDDLIPKLSKSGKSANRKSAEEMKRKENFAVQIIYKSEGKWIGPVLWEMSKTLANKYLGLAIKRDVSHPEKGYNLSITRTGTTMTSTEYSDIDRDDEKSAVPEKFLNLLEPFGSVLKQYDEAKQKSEYYGHEQDEEEEEEKPSGKKKPTDDDEEEEEKEKKPNKKKPVDEDEEESGGDESDEEEEKPSNKNKKKPADEDEEEEAVSDDDDIPNLEDEEDEEEKPKAGKKKPADEEEESGDEDEEEKPKGKKGKASEEDEEESEEEEEKPKSGKGKKKPADDDDDE